MDKITRFIKTSGVYLFGSVLTKLISMLLLPLYTNHIMPNEFGMYDLVVSIVSFFVPVVFFQVWDGMFRFVFEKNETNEKYEVISNSFFIWCFGLVLYLVIYFSLSAHIEFGNVILIFIYGVLVSLNYQVSFLARSFMMNRLFVLTGILNTTINAVLNIILITTLNRGINSLYFSAILGYLAQIIIIIIYIKPYKMIRIKSYNKRLQLEMLKFSIPLCIATISYWLLSGYTRIIISQDIGTYANGLYAVANKFSSLVVLLVTVFQYAWNEVAYLMVKSKERKQSYEKSLSYIYRLIVLGSGMFLMFVKFIFPILVNEQYNDSIYIIPILLIGVAANSLAGFSGTIFLAEKDTKWILGSTIISSIVNILITRPLISIWGLYGAISALTTSFIGLLVIRLIVLKFMFSINLSIRESLYLLILAISVFSFYLYNSVFVLLIVFIVNLLAVIISFKEILILILRAFSERGGKSE